MKKRSIVYILLAVMALAVMVLAACNETQQTAIEILQEKYNEISAAKTIEQKIEIKKGTLLNYARELTYTKGDGYDVTGTEKYRNDASQDEPFTVEQVNDHYEAVTSFVPALTLNVDYFNTGYNLTETSLAATVRAENISQVLKVEGTDLKLPTSGLTLQMTVTGDHLTNLTISYVSDGNNVTITLTFAY